jgi:hypothetical protein
MIKNADALFEDSLIVFDPLEPFRDSGDADEPMSP